ncbi:hypothetical protein ACFLV3_00240 [Chloroflexota bacterium]
MNWQDIWRLAKSDYVKLVPIMALAFYLAFIPHLTYPYPVHIDEWVHMALSKAMLGAQDTTFIAPFLGQSTLSISSNLEAGFHLFFGVFQSISGISWIDIFRYFPSIVFMMTVLSVYIVARRQGFGWEAALLTCLIPTTVGILGPAFLVPVAMGLLFIPLSLFVVFNSRTWWSCLALFLFTSFLLTIHAPSAICVAIILAPYVLLNFKGNFKHSLGLTLALAIPFLAPFPWIFALLLPTAKSLLSPVYPAEYVTFPLVIKTYGYIPIALCLLGTFILWIRGERNNHGLVLGLLAILAMLVVFFTLHRGVHIMYERGLMFMMLMASIVAGAGLMGIRKLRLPEWLSTWPNSDIVTKAVGIVSCVVLVALTFTIAIPNRQDDPYYLMIDGQDYQAFRWIEDNIGAGYEKAILDPWKATAFVAITGKYVYTRIHAFPYPRDEEAYAFLRGGCTDTAFLKENGISIVYTLGECNNPDLVEVENNVYLLRETELQ